MKKYSLTIFGFVLQCFGISFMLYGLNNSRFLVWTGLSILFIGFALIIAGVISNMNKTK
jgi:uncharacterized membrane protein YoaK (UPF0700 family)